VIQQAGALAMVARRTITPMLTGTGGQTGGNGADAKPRPAAPPQSAPAARRVVRPADAPRPPVVTKPADAPKAIDESKG
jgi:hypothetical protein